jgi:hypothetical protein
MVRASIIRAIEKRAANFGSCANEYAQKVYHSYPSSALMSARKLGFSVDDIAGDMLIEYKAKPQELYELPNPLDPRICLGTIEITTITN